MPQKVDFFSILHDSEIAEENNETTGKLKLKIMMKFGGQNTNYSDPKKNYKVTSSNYFWVSKNLNMLKKNPPLNIAILNPPP